MPHIWEISNDKAKEFFMRSSSYSHAPLPSYFDFTELLQNIDTECSQTTKIYNPQVGDNNYVFYSNKDGVYAWRPLALIHPLVYVQLVNLITKKDNWIKLQYKFKEFGNTNGKIFCYSHIPYAEAINDKISKNAGLGIKNFVLAEKASLEYTLQYSMLFNADVQDCYASIYTHAIAWAVETKSIAKQNKNDKNLLGNNIDKLIQNSQNGQTNGIPQGSVLMDFIAEILLGYVDIELLNKLEELEKDMHSEFDYKIIRYRDDYKIFTNDLNTADTIIKKLSETLLSVGLKLNSAKTVASDDIILGCLKKDKKNRFFFIDDKDMLIHLIKIYAFSKENKNSKQISALLAKFYKKMHKLDETYEKIIDYNNSKFLDKIKDIPLASMVAILTEMLVVNPNCIQDICTILSVIINLLAHNPEKQEKLFKLIEDKTKSVSNNTILELWLQRIATKIDYYPEVKTDLAQIVYSSLPSTKRSDYKDVDIWQINDPTSKLDVSIKNIVQTTPFVDINKYNELSKVMTNKEISPFGYDS